MVPTFSDCQISLTFPLSVPFLQYFHLKFHSLFKVWHHISMVFYFSTIFRKIPRLSHSDQNSFTFFRLENDALPFFQVFQSRWEPWTVLLRPVHTEQLRLQHRKQLISTIKLLIFYGIILRKISFSLSQSFNVISPMDIHRSFTALNDFLLFVDTIWIYWNMNCGAHLKMCDS